LTRTLVHPALGFAFLALAAGCGPKAPNAASVGQGAASVGQGNDAETPAPAQWFRGRLRQLPPWGDELRRRIDPVVDGWTSEAWALRIEGELPVRIRAMLGGDLHGLQELFDDSSGEVSALWPAKFETLFEDGDVTVRRGPDLSKELHPRAELPVLLDAWKASLRDVPDPRVDVAVDGLTLRDDGSFETHIRLRVSGAAGKGSVQHNVRWNARWRAGAKTNSAAAPRLLTLSVESFEEVRTRVRPLAELTREVLSKCDGFEEEILRGNDDYHLHEDRFSTQPMLGMHGLAVGDVDGDGLEDLYLPQPGGQPNRLLIHQADGTVRDGAHAAGLDVLDNCGAALILDFDGDGREDVAVALG
jgi:hypothetical protein